VSLTLHDRPAIERGDTGRFALRIEFVPNLDPGYRVAEEDCSWGRLTIWARGRNLCEHIDRREVRSHVEWYLLPVLEWLAANWDFLLHEQRPPVANEGGSGWQSFATTNHPDRFEKPDGEWDESAAEENYQWGERHALRHCRSGGLFPDVVLRRRQHDLEVSWGPTPLAGTPDSFGFVAPEGVARVPVAEAAEILHAVLTQAVGALVQDAPGSARLLALQQQVVALTAAERCSQRVAILAGLGRGREQWQVWWQQLRTRLEREVGLSRAALRAWLEPADDCALCVCGSCEAAVMFGSASPTLTEDDVFALAGQVIQASSTSPSADWSRLSGEPQPWQGEAEPWRDGYGLADEWAERAGLAGIPGGFVDVEGHLRDLGVSVADIELSDRGTSGLAVQPVGAAPRVVVNLRNPKCRYPTGRRFALAHELCHLIHDREVGRALALISGPWASREVEMRANAFAAELLMPYSVLRDACQALAAPPDTASIVAMAQRLHVSRNALVHHLCNVRLIDEVTRDDLLGDWAERQGN